MEEKQISKLETLHNKIYKETEEYGRTQFVSRIVDLENNWNELKKDIEDKIEIIEEQYIKNRMKFSELFIIEMRSRKRGYERILNRMQELERGEEWHLLKSAEEKL